VTERGLRFGVVGAGRVAHAHAEAIRRIPAMARLVAVADLRIEAARALADVTGALAYGDVASMSSGMALDAVVICTPPVSHREVALHCLSQGVHVLCEKPLSIGNRAAREMLAAAKRFDATLTMASKFRYVPDVLRAAELVASGLIGDLVRVENCFTSWVDMSQRWNSDPRISGGGVLIDNGTHAVDLLRYIAGPLGEIQVVEGARAQGLTVEDTVHVAVSSRDGVRGTIDLSWSLGNTENAYLRLLGSEGIVSVGWKESTWWRRGEAPVRFGEGYDKMQAFTEQLRNFCGAVRGDEASMVTPADAMASVEVIQAGYRSLEIGRPVRLSAASTARDPVGPAISSHSVEHA
jgi:predicted dehydrogenase